MQVTGIDHVVFNVRDAEASVAWWRDVLGLEPVRLDEWRRGEVPFVSVRISAGTILDLFVTERTGENVDHIAIQVADADLDELAASGRFDVVRGPMDVFGARGQGRGLYVRDPDGNVIELRTYPAA
jgi:catechol 2,3-dioxygenase-like lactoylglutathione lyase family enzyme